MIRLAAAVATIAAVAPAARANDRPGGGGQCVSSWCGTPSGWVTPPGSADPDTVPTTILQVGTAGEQLGPGSESAAVLGLDFRFPLSLRIDGAGVDNRVMRVRVNGQFLGWRTGARSDVDRGGSLALGYTETLHWLSRHSKLALLLDVEGATGLATRGGLGLRTRDTSARAVGAAGLALGLHSRIGGLRAHVRALHALTADPGWANAAELGLGVATRFDWPGFHGPLPLELWADVRLRRGLGDAGEAREREIASGLSFIPADGFTRIGVVGLATRERLADGTSGDGRTLMVQFERPFGDP